ncbi:C40 family peptidase [Pseudozobellia thermophila]|uniref:SH3 domain-containing protein n=1 Tax=Pseudozobellia thermophila TaxID=192903 RepID=A0A1M6BGZ5_9FLAO|nr:C40 family peptidase [Pseudozobellia thermophila]SHI47956.1 SH3 domain-containing protein [Pseudozobellia thermophila]
MIRIEMTREKLLGCLVGLLVLVMASCEGLSKKEQALLKKIEEVRQEFAPDKRTALFDVRVFTDSKKYILKGETDNEGALVKLRETLTESGFDFTDEIEVLPSEALDGLTQAVVNLSVANLRSNPKHSAELATQATLGTPVKVLKQDGGWYYIQTPDKYLSWVDDGGIEPMDKTTFDRWQGAKKIIFTQTYGHSFADEGRNQVVSDLVAGNILELTGTTGDYFQVAYPDGRKALVAMAEAQPYDEWLEGLDPSPENLVATSKELMGVPYLWGGTSTKGMDCSGFTKTVYFLNGMVIPRDASQQVHTGKPVDSVQDFDRLERGDLLFFGKKATDSTAEKVVHVGMWIGNNEFIHASDRVRISSMDPDADNYDAFNHKRYLRSKRILKEKDEGLISLADNPLFKD